MTAVIHYPCVCCGHLTLGDPPGSFEICSVCFWEDDRVQLRWPDWAGGANRPSLVEAQANFKEFGASEQRFVTKVRPPGDDEPLEQNWRPIDPDRDHFEPRGRQEAPWPVDCTVLYWWRQRDTGFWRRSS
ncbi:CPCC family cysteine-rich protein [Streptomyces sp. NPDC050759]|uniref:CPCC family cysteine-rich protein n=1 Tax=Streptomyces sp. NPDC050759 TaxID=3365635 RepID=UPI00379164AE